MTPPTMPGEVWLGDIDGPVCVTVTDGKVRAWFWTDSRRAEWIESAVPSLSRGIFEAWALSLLAERAEVRALLYAATTESTPDAARRVGETIERERVERRKRPGVGPGFVDY